MAAASHKNDLRSFIVLGQTAFRCFTVDMIQVAAGMIHRFHHHVEGDLSGGGKEIGDQQNQGGHQGKGGEVPHPLSDASVREFIEKNAKYVQNLDV